MSAHLTATSPLSVVAVAAHRAGRGASRGSDLQPAQQRAVIGAILAAHLVGAWGLLQVEAVRKAVVEAAPVFVSLLDAPPRPELPPPPPPPPKPVRKAPPPPAPVIAAPPAPTPVPATFAVPPPPTEPVVQEPPAPPAPPLPTPSPPAPPTPPAPPPAPRSIPPSAVQYLVPPDPVYPRTSIRLNESGTVIVRVFIDEGGLPRQVLLAQSSGFGRLDEAAVTAVQKARFKPPTDNGLPISGWARIPIHLELEK